MHPLTANENFRPRFWSRVRESAVPPSMIESATARRVAGDWAGACAAARVDVELNLKALGRQVAAQVRDDLRHLVPDLLRWHFPRIGPDGLLRPGLTVSLARYPPLHLVARTPPAWAAAGQRISLALWDPSEPRAGAGAHPHPRPDRRFRLDLHRHLWDVRRTGELRERAGENRWAAEAALLLRADKSPADAVIVRLSSRRRLLLKPGAGPPTEISSRSVARALPVLPDAATWALPDLELLNAGLIEADRLHPLVASALRPDHRPVSRSPDGPRDSRLVECRGAKHRIGVVNGVLVALDHDADEIRREELLVSLGGKPLPCLRMIDDITGALNDELATAARHQVAHGLYRAGLAGSCPLPSIRDIRRRREVQGHPRHATRR